MKVRVEVMLKTSVLDPQGKAVEHALKMLGFANAVDVRVGKLIELDIAAPTVEAALAEARSMAEKLLVNPIIEDFRIHGV